MAGISFSHQIGTLNLRLPPTEVDWDYKMNTQTFTTYGGEVVQVLGLTFNKVVFQGRFGKEGPHGKNLITQNGRRILVPRSTTEYTNWKTNEPYGVGLSQMLEYFKTYFSAASQGNDRRTNMHYNQDPMKVRYMGANETIVDPINNKTQIEWQVYPTSFPSYRRSNEDFAPEWKIECEVYEAPFEINANVEQKIFDNFREGIGWRPMNEFSDPLAFAFDSKNPNREQAIKAAMIEADKISDQVIGYWRNTVPALTPTAIEELILSGASLPNVYNLNKKNKNRNRPIFGGGNAGGGAGTGIAGTSGQPGQQPGETDGAYADRMNPAPGGIGDNYCKGGAPVMFSGAWLGPGSDDRHDLSYTQNIGGGRWEDCNGGVYDEKGRVV